MKAIGLLFSGVRVSNRLFEVHRWDMLSTRMMCNGYTDCPDGSDKRNCLKFVIVTVVVVVVVVVVAA